MTSPSSTSTKRPRSSSWSATSSAIVVLPAAGRPVNQSTNPHIGIENRLGAQRDFERGARAGGRAKRERPADRLRPLAHVAQALAGSVFRLLEADAVIADEHEPPGGALPDPHP